MSQLFSFKNDFGELRMKKNIPTHEEAARNLLVLLDGNQWRGKSVAIVRRGSKNKFWVQTIITDMQSEERQEYLVEYEGLVTAWFGLKSGKKVFEQLLIEMNYVMWNAKSLSTFTDEHEREWIQLDIEHNTSGTWHSIAIEQESMVGAFIALRDEIEDFPRIVKTALAAIARLL